MFYDIQDCLTNSGRSSPIALIYIGVKEDDKDNLEESTGLATYSNIEPTVFLIYPYLKTYGSKRLE